MSAGLRRWAPSLAWSAAALAAIWIGAWTDPGMGHWANFPHFMTTVMVVFWCSVLSAVSLPKS